MGQPCFNLERKPDKNWKGHKTHAMWRRANNVHCSTCNGKASQQDGEFQVSQKLVAPCKEGSSSTQQSALTFFKKPEEAMPGQSG